MNRNASYLIVVLSLAACGGDEDVPDTIEPQSVYVGRCQSPRSGNDPFSGLPFADEQGTLLDEQLWLRSWTDETYLWYSEVPANNPKQYATSVDYFDDLKSNALTPSGKPRDRFHFFYPTSYWEGLSQSGVEPSYGFQMVLLSSAPPRKAMIAYTELGTPADAAGLLRGAEIKAVDGAAVIDGSADVLNAGLFPAGPGETHSMVILDPGASTSRTITLTSENVTSTPVQHVGRLPAPNDDVGYMLFNDHIATAEKGLVDAITQLQGVTDLIIDMRYNGGGYLAIASQLGYMIADPTLSTGKTFEQTKFNDKHPTTDAVTGQRLVPTPFIDETIGLSVDEGQPLPTLGLQRVFVLTTRGTCSASEAVMNGLAGIGVDVIQIGTATCGKPYGFYPADNCGTTYFSIQFEGVNNKGFGDYADGFVPGPGGIFAHSCLVSDDFTHVLGDPGEAQLAAALYYRDHQSCPPPPAGLRERGAAADGEVPKSAWRQNRIMLPPR